MRGTVKNYDADKGFGFIRPDDGGEDVFVHITALRAGERFPLNCGDVVEFERVQGRKPGKWQAAHVDVLVSAP
jgi:CspA family cold shock protein